VEAVSDLPGQKLGQATPNETGKLIREDEKPLPLGMGRCHKSILTGLALGTRLIHVQTDLDLFIAWYYNIPFGASNRDRFPT